MRDLPVPRKALDIIGASGRSSQTEGALGIINIVDEDFALCPRCRDDTGLQGVELHSLGRSSMFRCSGDKRVSCARGKLLRIPQVERAVLEGAGDDAPGMLLVWRSPCNVVEAIVLVELALVVDVSGQCQPSIPRVGADACNRLELQALALVVEVEIPEFESRLIREVVCNCSGARACYQ